MSSATANRDLFTLGRELGLLTPDVADSLAAEAERTGRSAEWLLLQKGLLSPVQMDILQTLSRPTESLPGYEVLSVIGHGGMGVVYRARQRNLNRIVALKTLLTSQVSDSSLLARFEQEAQTVARLQHPNIVAAYDFGRHEGRLFFAMELVAGEDLEQLTHRRGTLDEPLAWGLARQIASGLAHAAQAGVVHRDVKPANVLLVEMPTGCPVPAGLPLVKIADFGLAFLHREAETHTRLTTANVAVGSPHYMAPEQFSGTAVDSRADMYSLGATLFHMFAGQPPFSGPLSAVISQKVRGDLPDFRRHCPHASAESIDLITSLMRFDPRDRPRDYAELLRRIDSLPAAAVGPYRLDSGSRGPPVSQTHLAPTMVLDSVQTAVEKPTPPVPPTRSRRGLLIAVGVVLAVAAGLFGVWRGTKPPTRPTDDLTESDWQCFLFRDSLDGWQPVFGEWSDGRDDERAKVIVGRNGQIRRSFQPEAAAAKKTLDHYHLQLQVNLHQARAVEIHFGIDVRGQSRSVLRLTRDGAQIGQRLDDRGEFVARQKPIPLSPADEGYLAIRIERRRAGWWAYCQDRLIGSLPLAASALEFRLSAEGGPAWFGDVELTELSPGKSGD